MGSISGGPSAPTRVTAVFPDSIVSFMLPGGATLMELTEFLISLGEWRHGRPIAIDVQLGA